MSFLLMVFLTLVCLFEAYPSPLLGHGSAAVGIGLTWGSVAVLAAHAFWLSRRVCGVFREDSGLERLCGENARRDRLLNRYEAARHRHQIVLLAGYVLALGVFGWGWVVQHDWSWEGHGLLPGAELLLLAPFLATQLLSWAFFYDADRAIHRAAQRPRPAGPRNGELPDGPPLPSGAPAPAPFGSRVGYVAFQLRQKLALVFIPILLLIVRNEVLRLFPQVCQERRDLVEAVGVVGVAALFIGMPWVVRLFLGLTPLPDGPLRQRLLASARRLHFRFSDLLLWNTRSGMANAMVVGILPWVRYVVFTDRLLEDFSEDEVEAVFGHEVGHIRHHHILCYLGFLLASMFALGLAANLYLKDLFDLLASGLAYLPGGVLSPSARESLDELLSQPNRQYLEVFPIIGLLLPYIFVVFGFLSRRCERQADVFGCRAVSCQQDGCCGHPPGLPLPARGRGLCPTGITTFIRALEKVALVNGISRDRPGFLHSWQHSTIARRVEFLQRILRDRSVEARFQRRVALIKWGLFLVLGGTLLFLLSQNGWQP